MLYHGEVVYRNDQIVGDVRSASYGHSLGGAIGLAMIELPSNVIVNKEYQKSGDWSVDIAGIRYPITVSALPMYDPKNLKIKA